MELEFEIKGKVKVNIDESILKKITEDYKGNYEEYFELYPIDKDSIDWDLENKEYETDNLLIALNKYRVDNGFNDNYELPKNLMLKKQLKNYYYMDSLEQLKNYHSEDNLEEFIFNKKELEYLSFYADEHNPKNELNFVYFDKENILATDTRVLVCNKNNSLYSDIYIPKVFCEAYVLFDEVKIFFEKSLDLIYLVFDGKIYKDSFKNFKFYEYKRIIPKEFKTILKTVEMIENSKTLLLEKEIKAFAYRFEDNYLCAKLNIDLSLEFVGINSYALPFMLFNNTKDKLQIVMPLLLENNEIEKCLKVENILTTV